VALTTIDRIFALAVDHSQGTQVCTLTSHLKLIPITVLRGASTHSHFASTLDCHDVTTVETDFAFVERIVFSLG
jgi:hypothetical protein